MEIILLVFLVVFIIIIFNKQASNAKKNQEDFQKITNSINDLKKQISSLQVSSKEVTKPLFKEEKVVLPTPPLPKVDTPIIKEKKEEIKIPLPRVAFNVETPIPSISQKKQEIPRVTIPAEPQKSWYEKFKEKNPDIEKFIGENLINKIGILILVLGIGFFVKYAIDKDWINETGRVGIGILSGSIVMTIAHKLRKKYAAFSSVFVGGAISIFYLTIGIAFHDYKIFSQTTAFIIMVGITIFSAFVSVAYNRKELAIISLIGGFGVPFMVSTGEGNYKILLTYIAILNIGMLIIAYFKKWNLVTLLSFIFTIILFGGWFTIDFYDKKFPYDGALFFASLFYIIFSIATVINNIRNKGNFTNVEYGILLSNTALYFGIGATLLTNWNTEYKGLFTLALALYNLVFAMILYKKFGINKNAIYVLLGLALTFVTITVPFQFQGNYITLFWACEAVLLLWLSQKSKITMFKLGSIIIQILMLLSLLIDWTQNYGIHSTNILNPFINKIFITGLFAIVSLIATYQLLKKEPSFSSIWGVNINNSYYKNIILVSTIIVAYFVGILEISYQCTATFKNYYSGLSLSVLYHFLFSVILLFFIQRFKKWIYIGNILATINIVLYIITFYKLSNDELVENIYLNTNNHTAFFVHYIILGCLGYFIYYLIENRKEQVLSKLYNNKYVLWVLAFFIIYILSNEIMIHGLFFAKNIINQTELAKIYPNTTGVNYGKYIFIEDKISFIKTQIIKIGYPILWGILSFIFLIIGIKKQNKQLRIIALTLLGITVLKLFIYDIKNVSETGKIIAFILLGVLILIISFVYQKIKKLVIDEPQNKDNEENN